MLTLPISQRQLYVAKAVLAWLFVMGANAVLVGASALSIALLGVAGASLKGAFVFPLMALLAKISLACLPVLLIQQALLLAAGARRRAARPHRLRAGKARDRNLKLIAGSTPAL